MIHNVHQGLVLAATLIGAASHGTFTFGARRSSGRICGHDMGHADREPPRNRPCPCGSGRKFKKCCRLTNESEVANG